MLPKQESGICNVHQRKQMQKLGRTCGVFLVVWLVEVRLLIALTGYSTLIVKFSYVTSDPLWPLH